MTMVLNMAKESLQMSWESLLIWRWVAQKVDYHKGKGDAVVVRWALKKKEAATQKEHMLIGRWFKRQVTGGLHSINSENRKLVDSSLQWPGKKNVHLEFYTRLLKSFQQWEDERNEIFPGKQKLSFSLNEVMKKIINTDQKWYVPGK